MHRSKVITMAAAGLLALSLSARADDEEDARLKRQAETAEQQRAAAAADREGRGDREAGQRERRRDAETVEGERRRAETFDRDRGRARGEAAMPGPSEMPRRPGGLGMMGPRGVPSPERLRETDPEMFELEQNDQRLDKQSHEMAEQYRRAPEGRIRDELRAKLQETVKQHFKARQERRELEVKRLQAQLERLQSAVERRAKDADTIINQRMSQLLGEEDSGF